MARGRKKDLTIAPTRSLVQQRDYRARRALYVTHLEERCHKAEEENLQLRKELTETRERLVNPAMLLPETAAASSELLLHLSSARDALLKFNQLAFPNTHDSSEFISPHLTHATSLSQHADSTTPSSSTLGSHTNTRSRKELYVDDSYPQFTSPFSSPATTIFEDPSLNSDKCCGGIINCNELSESEDNQSTSSRMSA